MSAMMMDVSQVKAFGAKLAAAPEKKLRKAAQITKRGAQNVKNDIRADLSTARSARRKFARIQIGYEMETRGNVVQAKIAPHAGGVNNLDNIAFFGGANGGGGTHKFYQHAEAEMSRFASYIQELAGEL